MNDYEKKLADFCGVSDVGDVSDGYHYEDSYWDLFDCQELEKAKHWDGYTEEDVMRLMSLRQTIDHPKHYNKPGHKECIEEMLDRFGPTAVYWFCTLNAYKYEYRAGEKGPADVDLGKAQWYSNYAKGLDIAHNDEEEY